MQKNHPDRNPQNTNGVSKQQWSRWTLVGKHVFNKVYESFLPNQDIMASPGFIKKGGMTDEEWKVIAWNAAFMAAGITSRGEKILIKDLTKEIMNGD